MERNRRFLVFYHAGESNYAFDRGGLDDKDVKHSAGFAPSHGPSCSRNLFRSQKFETVQSQAMTPAVNQVGLEDNHTNR